MIFWLINICPFYGLSYFGGKFAMFYPNVRETTNLAQYGIMASGRNFHPRKGKHIRNNCTYRLRKGQGEIFSYYFDE